MELTSSVTGWLGLPLALTIGFLLGASPFTWPVLALATGARAVSAESERPTFSPVVLGIGAAIIVVYAGLGLVAERLDEVLRVGIGSWVGVGYASISVASLIGGGVLLAKPALVCRTTTQEQRRQRGPVAGFLIGVPVALVNCPACAGIITGVALAAASTGSTVYAVAAMALLGVGHTLALVVGSVIILRPVDDIFRVAAAVQRTGALLLIGVGIWYAVQASRYGLTVAEPLP